jgi:hypothetical protein
MVMTHVDLIEKLLKYVYGEICQQAIQSRRSDTLFQVHARRPQLQEDRDAATLPGVASALFGFRYAYRGVIKKGRRCLVLRALLGARAMFVCQDSALSAGTNGVTVDFGCRQAGVGPILTFSGLRDGDGFRGRQAVCVRSGYGSDILGDADWDQPHN